MTELAPLRPSPEEMGLLYSWAQGRVAGRATDLSSLVAHSPSVALRGPLFIALDNLSELLQDDGNSA